MKVWQGREIKGILIKKSEIRIKIFFKLYIGSAIGNHVEQCTAWFLIFHNAHQKSYKHIEPFLKKEYGNKNKGEG